MSTRIILAGLLGVALLASAIPASARIRVAISAPLMNARGAESHGDIAAAMRAVKAAEAVPNQTDEEKEAVAHVKALVMHAGKDVDFSAYGTDWTPAYEPPPREPPPPPPPPVSQP
ncbi:MAG TPA: hypothetical protein VG798_00560 [Rhizomicrobium sp.]|nr:hypothetical protein [Rhizomicrobium sp.]